MPRNTEIVINTELAGALRRKHPRWAEQRAITVEATGVLLGDPAAKPDIVLVHPGGSPVIVETEVLPAQSVEAEARNRLGRYIEATDEVVENAVAVRMPHGLRESPLSLAESIESSEFEYCLLSLTGEEHAPQGIVRFPSVGWLRGGIDDLTGFIELTSLSEQLVMKGTLALERGVAAAAHVLRSGDGSTFLLKMARILKQEDGEQTSRMSMAILANALMFHTAIAGDHDVATLAELRMASRPSISRQQVLNEWAKILRINYWPIFKIASDLLKVIPARKATRILDELAAVADEMAGIGVTTTHDLSGQMFGRLIADRKFLATFYTLPSSAMLLAELAVSRLKVDYSRPERLMDLRIADLACGTGALLSAAYVRIATRHRRTGGDDRLIHAEMMEKALIGADIMPAATHLTASMLSAAHPAVPFGNTMIYTMPYGDQDNGRPVAIGSLDLIAEERVLSLFGTGRMATAGSGDVDVDVDERRFVMAHDSADLVVMNPPYTRPTNHKVARVPVPSFAGFSTSEEEQRRMSAALKEIYRWMPDRVGDGNAGLASNFVDLGHAKLRPGGVLALVMPVALVSGASWSKVRNLLRRQYHDLTMVTITAVRERDRSFSEDTDMGEVLVIATKNGAPDGDGDLDGRTLYVNLSRRPTSITSAVEVARSVTAAAGTDRGWLMVGEEEAGCFIRAGIGDGGCVGVREPDVATAALGLPEGRLELARIEATDLPLTTLGSLGDRGFYHLDIKGPNRGPFEMHDLPPGQVASYPALSRHDARRERRMVVEPDTQGRVHQGYEAKALQVWETATRLHFNLDFRLNSQSLAACLTPTNSIGGTAWPNFVLCDPTWEPAAALWANTTPGLISFWFAGTRQHQGRARLTIKTLPSLPMLDLRSLSASQIDRAKRIFDEFATREFLPAHQAHLDGTRRDLDRAVLIDLLGLDESVLEPLAVLREQWCREPSVHGGVGGLT